MMSGKVIVKSGTSTSMSGKDIVRSGKGNLKSREVSKRRRKVIMKSGKDIVMSGKGNLKSGVLRVKSWTRSIGKA